MGQDQLVSFYSAFTTYTAELKPSHASTPPKSSKCEPGPAIPADGRTKEREQHKETLAASAKRAFQSFQADISECHQLVVVSRLIAVIDCMISLASTASGPGYTKPTFVSEPRLSITQGRHPMVEALRDQAYVPFDIDFSESEGRSKVITGPNMAGKSSCVRAAALIVCLAQIGSFVPADAATLGIHDAVLT